MAYENLCSDGEPKDVTNIDDSALKENTDDSIQNLVSDMQSHFKTMSQTILNRIDEMGTRIDQLEFMLNDLISEVETTEAKKEQIQTQNVALNRESELEVKKKGDEVPGNIDFK
ncbi:hypothetical protein FG386_000020 [Cryptosporidium ryanae]|uniref:uncharacterized protein n=1 Tax=Cryptosporidium ryanae TaxID=515981 RepID=UPI00351A973D|nr:hypothetical protein FG386_000020 [Cryptosporidium ryanae]